MRLLHPSSFLRFLAPLLGGVTLAGTCLYASTGLAAERVVLKYGIVQGSIPVSDLRTLADTGQAPPTLASYLKLANQDPHSVQKTLNREIKIDPVVLDRSLNSPLGEAVLDEVGQTVHTPRGGADRQALRAALVLSASKDSKVSLIEVIENYPTQEVQIEGKTLVTAYRRIDNLASQAQKVINVLERLKF